MHHIDLQCGYNYYCHKKGERESINFPRSTEMNEKEEENVREPTLDTIYVIQ